MTLAMIPLTTVKTSLLIMLFVMVSEKGWVPSGPAGGAFGSGFAASVSFVWPEIDITCNTQ